MGFKGGSLSASPGRAGQRRTRLRNRGTALRFGTSRRSEGDAAGGGRPHRHVEKNENCPEEPMSQLGRGERQDPSHRPACTGHPLPASTDQSPARDRHAPAVSCNRRGQATPRPSHRAGRPAGRAGSQNLRKQPNILLYMILRSFESSGGIKTRLAGRMRGRVHVRTCEPKPRWRGRKRG